MLEEVVVIVWVEKRLDSISTVDCSNGNVLCGIGKNLWTYLNESLHQKSSSLFE